MEDDKFRVMVKRVFLMKKVRLSVSVLKDYGINWIAIRLLYSIIKKLGIRSKLMPVKRFDDFKNDIVNSLSYENFKEMLTNRFIEMDVKSFIQYQRNLGNKEKRSILERAGSVQKGTIYGFGNLELNYGVPLNWFKNPLDEKSFDCSNHWSLIPDFGLAGDIKLGWEISRFHFVFDLIKAHAITNDEKYYKEFIDLFTNWMEHNQPEKGINWKCSQEISIRLLSITYGFRYFSEFYLIENEIIINYYLLMESSLKHVFANKNYALKSIKNDHAFVEMFALYIFGGMISSSRYKKYQEIGAKQFEKQIFDQIYDDGGYKQNSFNYHRLILQLSAVYLHHNKQSSPKIGEYINKSIQFLNSAIMNELGNVPNFGPSDSALVFHYSNDIKNFRKTLNLCNYLVNGKILYNSSSDFEEICWFTSAEKLYIQEANNNISTFKQSGYWYLKNEKWRVFFRAGKQWHRPFHNDMMHVDVWYKGVNVLCDMGTYSYNFNLNDSDFYNSYMAHNTLDISPTDKFKRTGKFLVTNWKNAEIILRDDNLICAEQSFDKNTRHQRKINVELDAVMIEDKVITRGEKTISISYNTQFRRVERISESEFLLSNENGDLFELSFMGYPSNATKFIINRSQNEESAIGWYSDSYLQRRHGNHICLKFRCENEVIIKSKLKRINQKHR